MYWMLILTDFFFQTEEEVIKTKMGIKLPKNMDTSSPIRVPLPSAPDSVSKIT